MLISSTSTRAPTLSTLRRLRTSNSEAIGLGNGDECCTLCHSPHDKSLQFLSQKFCTIIANKPILHFADQANNGFAGSFPIKHFSLFAYGGQRTQRCDTLTVEQTTCVVKGGETETFSKNATEHPHVTDSRLILSRHYWINSSQYRDHRAAVHNANSF